VTTLGALLCFSLVLAIEYAVSHVNLVELFVEVLFGEFGPVSEQFPEGFGDHERPGEIGTKSLDLVFSGCCLALGTRSGLGTGITTGIDVATVIILHAKHCLVLSKNHYGQIVPDRLRKIQQIDPEKMAKNLIQNIAEI